MFGAARDKIVISGVRAVDASETPLVHFIRLNPDGSPDSSFHLDKRLGDASLVGVIPDGRMHVKADFYLHTIQRAGKFFRLRADGSIDPDFTPAVETGWGIGSDSFRTVLSAPDGSLIWLSNSRLNNSADSIVKATGKTLSGIEYIAWTAKSVSVDEAWPELLSLTLYRTGDTTSPASVEFTTADGTAVAGRDYVAQSGRIDFAPLQIEREIRVQIINNTAPDGSREFRVILRQPSAGYALPAGTATVKILDDEFGFPPNSIHRLADGRVQLTLLNPPCGSSIQLQTSADLQHWTSISTNSTCGRPLLFEDANAASSMRFYRVMVLP